MNNHFNNYLTVCKEVDSISEQLVNIHSGHMQCKAGCDLCCMDYSIFPLEFHSILKLLKDRNIKPEVDANISEQQCVFLNKHKCTIYKERPIICRTHGLPLLYMNDKNEWELSACELNFTEFDMEEFDEENTFAQDKYNSKLFILNKEFIENFNEVKNGEFDLIPVKRLLDYI